MNIRNVLKLINLRSKLQVAVAIALAGSAGGGVAAYQYWDAVGCALPAKYQNVLNTLRPLQCENGIS